MAVPPVVGVVITEDSAVISGIDHRIDIDDPELNYLSCLFININLKLDKSTLAFPGQAPSIRMSDDVASLWGFLFRFCHVMQFSTGVTILVTSDSQENQLDSALTNSQHIAALS